MSGDGLVLAVADWADGHEPPGDPQITALYAPFAIW